MIDRSARTNNQKNVPPKVPCDKCWSLAQCIRMKHMLDPYVIAFLDIDDAPGVTPAKRSCKNSSSSSSSSPTGSEQVHSRLVRVEPRARGTP